MKPPALLLIASLMLEIPAPGLSHAMGDLQARRTERAPVVEAAGDSRKEPESTEVGAAEIVDGVIGRIEKSHTVRYRTHSKTGGWSETGWMIGTLVDVKQDTFAIKTVGGMRHVPLSSIRNLAVSAGRHQNTESGMKFGLIVGGAILVPVAILDASGKVAYFRRGVISRKVAAFVSLPIFLGSTLVGAATKSHKWIEVTPQRLLDLYVTPTQNGGLQVGVSFEL